MPAQRLPDHVYEFLSRYVTSPDELALLVLLMASGKRWWDARAAGQEVGVGERDARRMLERLASNNLLDIRVSDEVRYRFSPGTTALESAATDLLTAYRQRPALILRCGWLRRQPH